MWKSPSMVGGVLGLVLLLVGAPAAAAEKEAVFDMQEVSVFQPSEPDQPVIGLSLGGQYAQCTFVRLEEVKKYPELNSDRPIYGSVTFDHNRINPDAGMRFYFVIDESGEGEGGESETADSRSLLKSLAVALSGPTETTASSGKYDRLHFDANRDLDLTNDAVITPMKEPPARFTSSREVVFDYLNVPFDHGPELGKRPLKIMPRLRVSGLTRAYMTFTAAVARKGKIKIGEQEYNALLTQAGMITGRFDRPYTGLILTPVKPSGTSVRGWWGERYLCALRSVDGKLYQISATPTGDKLTVGPYRGESGLLKVGAGDRKGIEKLGLSGVFVSEKTLVPLGDVSSPVPAEKSPQYEIPVGDYAPTYISVDLGQLTVSLSQNYYSKEDPRIRRTGPAALSFKIRKDKPFVLDFSGKPTVAFTSPVKDQTFKPGDTIMLSAVIFDPELDVLFRDLQDTRQKVGERSYTGPDGEKLTVPRYASLDPTVAITDSSGKQVAEGKIPFG